MDRIDPPAAAHTADSNEPRGRTWTWLAVPAVALLGLLSTLAGFLAVRTWEAARMHQQFQVPASQHVSEFKQSLEREVAVLESLRSFWAASKGVDAEEFRDFVADHLRTNDDVVALEWLERVTPVGRDGFEARERPDHAGPYLITEFAPDGPRRAGRRDEYFPVTFAEPSDKSWNRRALGYDHASIRRRQAALEEAKASGSLVALGPIRLTSMGPSTDDQPSEPPVVLIFYMPVFAHPVATPAERDTALTGFLCGIFSLNLLFDDVVSRIDQDDIALDLFVTAEPAAGGTKDGIAYELVYSSTRAPGAPPPDFDERVHAPDSSTSRWSYAGREWDAVCSPTPQLVSRESEWYAWLVLLLGLGGTAGGTFAVKRMTSERRQIARELKQFWRLSAEMLGVLDSHGRLRRVNPAWNGLFGGTAESLVGTPLDTLAHPDDRAVTRNALRRLAETASTLTFEARLKSVGGRWRWIQFNAAPTDDRRAIHVVARDVTDQRNALEELEQRATIDPLTGTLTRRALFDRLTVEMHRAQRYGSPLSVALIDLDRFKEVNDTHGHAAGDDLLRALGRRLCSGLRESDAVGRFGGDEFVVVMPETSLAAGRQAAERLLESLRAESSVRATDGTPIPLRASVGVAEIGDGLKEAPQLIARADEALYRAKEAGRDRVS